jgi:hypothetical protein
MKPLKLLVVAAAPFVMGCDLSQKKPETALPRPAAISPSPDAVPTHPYGVSQAPAEAIADATRDEAAGQKSIRLFGRGVSRRLQTRV